MLLLATACLVAGCAKPAPQTPQAPAGMILIPETVFQMGSEQGGADERPVRAVRVSAFFMDRHEVTNDEFRKFVEATGYITTAERPLDPKDFPGVPAKDLKPGAAVFTSGDGWRYVPGANWRAPLGPGSDLRGKDQHPVVQVSWDDAWAYAKWVGKRLPTEAEWEAAARSAGPAAEFAWGSTDFDDDKPQANIWQGQFPEKDAGIDGFQGTAPVGSFRPNPLGLYDMAGNVWEWCSDWYRADAYEVMPGTNPQGPVASNDPAEPAVQKRVMRGGSFLCAASYCRGYRISARMKSSPDTGLSHVGFRCVKDVDVRN